MVAWALPADAVTVVGGPGTVDVMQGTPGQFSNAAFFQRTFSSSKLKGELLLIISSAPGKRS
jgi:hypothetical protein